jgi:hypothetical protein
MPQTMSVRFIVPVLVFALVASTAVGRVGENEQELVARYGAVTNRQPARKG